MAYILGFLILGVQIVTAVHIVRTGRDSTWIYVVMFVPLAGCAAYFIAEMLPELMGYRKVRSAASSIETGIKNVIDPGRDYRRLQEEAHLVDSAEAKRLLAEECARKGQYDEAIVYFRAAMKGIHAEDAALSYSLSEALLESGRFSEAVAELKRMETIDSRFRANERRLLLARSLDGMGEAKNAETEYRAIMDIVPGPEAKVRFAHLLYTQGRSIEARELLQQMLDQYKRLPSHARRLNQYWLDQARTALEQLRSA
jgi:hypothetical protein